MHVVSEKEKVIRKSARARIRAVPRLHEQWKKQRKSLGELISVGVGVLVFAAFSFGLPAGLGNATTDPPPPIRPLQYGPAVARLLILFPHEADR